MNALAPHSSPAPPRTSRPPARASASTHPAVLAPTTARSIAQLRASIAKELTNLRGLKVSDFESGERPPVRLEALAWSVAADVRAVLDAAASHYNTSAASSGRSTEPVLDLTSLARMELASLTKLIGHGADATPWQRVAVCDSLLQVSRRSLRALDTLVADLEGLPPPADDAALETALAVQIRRIYIELHRTVLGDDLPDCDTIRPRLRAAGNCIARTLSRSVAAAIRAHDRHTMRSFQGRIREALLGSRDDDATVDELTRIWQDLTNFTALLLDVNKREELRGHDLNAIVAALSLLAGRAPAAQCPDEVLDALRDCDGRDPELDALLARVTTVGTMRQCLDRVHMTLAPPSQRPVDPRHGSWSGLV